MPAEVIKSRVGDHVWFSYFKFCVVRNPFEKAVSYFYFLRNEGLISVDESVPDKSQFEQWLRQDGPPKDRQTYLIDGEFCLDDVIRYERLQEDIERICRRLDVPWVSANLGTFKSDIRPRTASVASMFTPAAEEIVRSYNDYEFRHFGYSDGVAESA